MSGTATAVHKAVRPDLLAPKRKHVRKIIVDSWNTNASMYKMLEKEGVTKNGCTCFKALTVIHKTLQEGPPRFLKRSYGALNFMRIIQNFWASQGSHDAHYGRLNVEYAYFLRGKITFHHKHPLVLGKLSLDDYKEKVKNQPEVPLQTRQQMISHLLDLQDMILRVQETIFSFNGRDLHESKKAALVPLVVESDAIIGITVHHLTALCARVKDSQDAQRYLDRFASYYPRFRLFFDNASRIPYVTDHIQVPQLPADSPHFAVTGELADMVPVAEQVITISTLMLDEGDGFHNNGGQQGQQGQEGQGNAAASSEASREAPAAEKSEESQQATSSENKTPEGWVSFGQPQEATTTDVPHAEPQHATVDSDAALLAKLREMENELQRREGEINYWKQVTANALRQAQGLNNACEENRQRADELEQHLSDLLQKQQKEKEDRLMRKLENAVGNVQNALQRLTNAEIPPNASSTPEQVLTAHEAMLDALKDVETAARNRNHQALISSIKRLVAAASEQAEHSKGVAQLTDDPELSAELSNAAEAATKVLRLLLDTIKENPYDADPIIAQCVAVRDASMILEHATQKIIEAERVNDSDDDLTDKATSELMNAAKVIEDAAKILAEAKRRAEEKARENKEDINVSGAIVDGAMAITDAIQTLIQKATVVQKENVAAGRARGEGAVYKKDVAWSEGLISAAKSVAASVKDLVKKADGTVNGDIETEDVIVSSKNVAASTTQLVVASRVRSDPNSKNQKNLEAAAKAVSQATRTMMLATQSSTEVKKEVVEEETRVALDGLSLTEVKIREMEQQANILKLEKELELSRLRLASMRKSEYKQ